MKSFTQWDQVPKHLGTKTQLSKEGLKLAPGQKPAGKKTGGYGPYNLYDKREAVPKRKMSEAQLSAARHNLEKARAALHCVDCGVYDKRDLDQNGRCLHCRVNHYIDEESRKATELLKELANRDDWIILDTETTGLGGNAEIVQIGIVDATGETLMSRLVKPTGDIEPGATAVHGIRAADVDGAPTWKQIYPDVVRLINDRIVLAYNAAFDCRMIRQTCNQHDLNAPDFDKWICVMELFAAHVGEWHRYHDNFKWHKLIEAVWMMGLRPHEDKRYKPHDATGDAWLTWLLVRAFEESK